MDTSNFVKAIIAGVMMIVVVMVVVVPVLQDASYNQLGYNTPTGYATADIPTGTMTPTANGFAIDGNAVEVEAYGWILISDTLRISQFSSSYLSITDYEREIQTGPSSLSIDGTAKTYSYTLSGTTYTGNLGNNAIIRSNAGELGIYSNKGFTVDQDAKVWTFASLYNISIEGTSSAPRINFIGPAGSLSSSNIGLLTSGSYSFPDGTATATIREGYIGEPNEVVYNIEAAPILDASITLDGQTYTTYTPNVVFAGPLTYTQVTDEGGAIKSMLDIVPLLMIVGVIVMIIGVAIVRR